MGKEEKTTIGASTWTKVKDPIYEVDCPRCGAIIFMSTPRFVDRLKKWAKQRKKTE